MPDAAERELNSQSHAGDKRLMSRRDVGGESRTAVVVLALNFYEIADWRWPSEPVRLPGKTMEKTVVV